MLRWLPLAVLAAAPAAHAQAYKTPAAAAGVVRAYYAAIDRGDFRAAYRLWSGDGQASGKSYAAFARGFAATARSSVRVGAPTDQEGAAGSLYITVPVMVEARLKNGRAQHFAGSYTLRRVNDVPGASWSQLHWRIASAKLRAVR